MQKARNQQDSSSFSLENKVFEKSEMKNEIIFWQKVVLTLFLLQFVHEVTLES